MIFATIVLVTSAALCIFYLQVTCENVLRREFEREFFESIANANRLEFVFIRKALQEFDTPVDYPWVRLALKCDYLALTYLLKNAANRKRSYSRDERLLMVYFRALFLVLTMFHALKISEKSVVLSMTAILEHFANVLGERVSHVRFGNVTASEYLLGL